MPQAPQNPRKKSRQRTDQQAQRTAMDDKAQPLAHQQKQAHLPEIFMSEQEKGGDSRAEGKKQIPQKDPNPPIIGPQNPIDPKKIIIRTQAKADRYRP